MIRSLPLLILLTLISVFLLYWIWRRRIALLALKSLSRVDKCRPLKNLSVIVPVRNDERIISSCIESILSQREIDFKVIVVDDSSDDSTLELIRRYESSNRLKIVEAGDTPRGWVGKNWACHLGYLNSEGELLVFMDSDTLLTKADTLRNAVCILERSRADVLSLYPIFRLESLWEKIWIPFAANYIYLLAHPSIVNSQDNPRSFLLGAFTVFRREVYERIGGHESIRGVLAEDKALGERVKAHGHRFLLAYGGEMITSRLGGGVTESWNSLKRVIPFSVKNRIEPIAASLIIASLFILPLITLIISIILQDITLTILSTIPMMLTIVLEAFELLRNHENPIYSVMYPAAAVFIILNLVYFSLKLRDIEVTWRGRKYRVKVFS